MAKHLVTGGSGFLGNLIAERLLGDGHEVKILDIWEDESRNKDIEYIQADIRDVERVSKAMKGMDFVHHNAALVPLARAGNEFWSVNVEGSRIVAECAAKSYVSKFIYMSSSAIYGIPKDLPINLQTRTLPVESYGISKLQGELAVKRVLSKTDIDCICVRPRTIIGPGRLGIFGILFSWISQDKNIYTIGSGKNLYQFVHADDLITAYLLASQEVGSFDYNVGAEEFDTIANTLKALIERVGSRSRLVPLPERLSISALKLLNALNLSPLVPYHYLAYSKSIYFDVSKLLEIGWRAKYSNLSMLVESYQYFMQTSKSRSSNKASLHTQVVEEKFLKILKRFS